MARPENQEVGLLVRSLRSMPARRSPEPAGGKLVEPVEGAKAGDLSWLKHASFKTKLAAKITKSSKPFVGGDECAASAWYPMGSVASAKEPHLALR